jgi:YHS domain-containing protein
MKKIILAFAVAVAAVAATPKPATNTLCPVLGGQVDAKSPKVEVRGQEYRVCCSMCNGELKATPDKFLKPDGTPKNAK